jgi:hypothetical protein
MPTQQPTQQPSVSPTLVPSASPVSTTYPKTNPNPKVTDASVRIDRSAVVLPIAAPLVGRADVRPDLLADRRVRSV